MASEKAERANDKTSATLLTEHPELLPFRVLLGKGRHVEGRDPVQGIVDEGAMLGEDPLGVRHSELLQDDCMERGMRAESDTIRCLADALALRCEKRLAL